MKPRKRPPVGADTSAGSEVRGLETHRRSYGVIPQGLIHFRTELISNLPAAAAVSMERVQHMTKSAIRRASQIEVNPQTKRNLQELFVNFTLILICLLLIYIIVLLSS
ncbi:hypothetical protein FQN60_006893 [Etheostoma spectabile]|uniref:Phospholamban n=2 Tax=Euacanthomorphacea TaxID=123369 RepID=A0A5J5CI02_9PERO|nr:hypothetical protein FQN60_006893 [Etheostoma spectabile]